MHKRITLNAAFCAFFCRALRYLTGTRLCSSPSAWAGGAGSIGVPASSRALPAQTSDRQIRQVTRTWQAHIRMTELAWGEQNYH